MPTDDQMQHTLTQADALRIAGRWEDALCLLRDTAHEAAQLGYEVQTRHALAEAKTMTDREIFAGIRSAAEREPVLAEAMTHAEAANSDELRASTWDAMGNSLHAAFIRSDDAHENPDELAFFERGLALRRTLGNQADIAESLFHVGLVYGVVRDDERAGLPYFQEAYDLSVQAGDKIMQSYAIRHLAYAKRTQGDEAAGSAGMLESLRLREEATFVPGIAFALIPVAEDALAAGDRTTALAYYTRARDILVSLDATGPAAWVDGLIAQLG